MNLKMMPGYIAPIHSTILKIRFKVANKHVWKEKKTFYCWRP